MIKQQKLSIFLLFLAIAFILGGMASRSFFEYSPAIGWIAGVILLFTSTKYAFRAYKNTRMKS